MQIQIDIPEELNKKLKFLKIEKDYSTLQEAVIYIINDWFKINLGDTK